MNYYPTETLDKWYKKLNFCTNLKLCISSPPKVMTVDAAHHPLSLELAPLKILLGLISCALKPLALLGRSPLGKGGLHD